MTNNLFDLFLQQNYLEVYEILLNHSNNYKLWTISSKYGMQNFNFIRIPQFSMYRPKITVNYEMVRVCEKVKFYDNDPTLAFKHGIISVGNHYFNDIIKCGNNIQQSQINKFTNIINSGILTSRPLTNFTSTEYGTIVSIKNSMVSNNGIVDLTSCQFLSKMIYSLNNIQYYKLFKNIIDINVINNISSTVITDMRANVDPIINELIKAGIVHINDTSGIALYINTYQNSINVINDIISSNSNDLFDTHYTFMDNLEIYNVNDKTICNVSVTVTSGIDLTDLKIDLRKDDFFETMKKLNNNSIALRK